MSRLMALVCALVFVPALGFAQQPCSTDARRVVNEIYRHMLERPADPASQGWADRLASGQMTVREVVRSVALSPEHLQRFGQGNMMDAVGTMYRHILGRQPDPGGQQAAAQAASNRGINSVIEQFIGSAEYNNNFGDWGVPGSGGVRFCAPGGAVSSNTQSQPSTPMAMRFRGMDTNNDGQISRREWRGNARAFANHDWNNDGILSGDEVRPGADAPNAADEFRDYASAADHRFDYLDVDNSGRIERDEWDGNAAAFDRLDRNGDGRLTRAELGTGTIAFRDLDVNNDGRISLDEWRWSRRAFDNQDDNDDGYITRREYRDGAVPTTGRY